jgi:excisionase family DNA binding protein
MTQQLLTVEDVAKRLDASVLTIRRWVREGQLPALRLGGRFIRLDWEEVVAALKANERSSQ